MTWKMEHCVSRPAEQLVVEGYRYWANGYVTRSIDPWEEAWKLFSSQLGSRDGSTALTSLSLFVRTLGACASCPLKTYPYGANLLCKTEYLVLGLISALQSNDKELTDMCLNNLSCPNRCSEITIAADTFAATLSGFDKKLLPIPIGVISEVLSSQDNTQTLQ